MNPWSSLVGGRRWCMHANRTGRGRGERRRRRCDTCRVLGVFCHGFCTPSVPPTRSRAVSLMTPTATKRHTPRERHPSRACIALVPCRRRESVSSNTTGHTYATGPGATAPDALAAPGHALLRHHRNDLGPARDLRLHPFLACVDASLSRPRCGMHAPRRL